MKKITLLILFISFGIAIPAQSFAQDKWSVSDSRKAEIIKRYKTLLERTPTEGLAFKKLLDYVGKGKGLDSLIKEYQGKVEKKPDRVSYRLILGHLLKAKNEYDPALEQYNEAVRLDPKDPVTWLSRGSVHLLLQHGPEATSDFEKALSLEKDKSKKQDILRKLADLAFNQRDWEAAQNYYDQLVQLDPRNQYLRLEYAQVLIKYKRYEKAEEQYKALIKLAGRDTKAKATTMRDLGDLYEKMGKEDKAIETYRDAMKLVRSGNWLHRELRQRIVGVYRRMDRLNELVEEYKGRWRNPNYDQSMELASLYDEVGDEENALKYYKRASSKNSRSVDPRIKVIRILERRGKDKEVIKAYEGLIRVAPSQHRFQFELVRHHFRLGNRKAAEKMLKRIESRFKRDPDVRVTLADTFMRYQMREDALRVYKRLLRMDPRNDAYILGLGEFYYQNSDVDLAVKTWEKLLNSNLGKAESNAKLGQVLAEHGMVEKGLRYYEKAVEISPDDPSIQRGLALAYERARRWANAVKTWQHILDTTDQSLTANEARGRIINIYRRQNRLRAKMREFQQEFASKNDTNSGFFLAEAYVKLGEFDDAEKVYVKLSEQGRKMGDDQGKKVEEQALVSLEKLYGQMNKYKKAIATLQRLAELRPINAKDYFHRIAELSLKLYESDQAVQYATMAVEKNPDDARAQARLGHIYHEMGRLESAVEQYRAAIDLDPRAFDIQMKLAETLVELGHFLEAERIYRLVTKKANDEGLILRAARRAISLAEIDGRMQEVEGDFFPLVYRTPPKPVYRKIMLEMYDRMTQPLVSRDRYGVATERAAAERELDEIGQRALPVLVDALQSDDLSQRATAVRLLGDFRQGNGALPLSRMVDDSKEQLRILAAVAVAQIGDERAAGPLARVTEDSDPTIREIAVWALGGVGGDVAIKKLIEILAKGQSWREQALAALSLGRIGGPKASKAITEFYESLGSSRYADYIAISVVWAMGRTGEKQAIPTLRTILATGTDRVAAVAAWSLAQIGGPQALDALFETYWGPNYQLRDRAGRGISLLATLSQTDAVSKERRRLEEIRLEARLINDRERNMDVEQMLDNLENQANHVDVVDTSPFVEENAGVIAGIISKTLKSDKRSTMLRDLVDPSGYLRLGVLTLSTDPDKAHEITRKLVTPIQSEFATVATELARPSDALALAVLSAIGDAGSVPIVLKHVSSKDPDVKAAAMLALGGFDGNSQAADAAEAGLKDSNFEVRLAAVTAYGRMHAGSKSDRVSSRASALLKDDYRSVQIASCRTLGMVESQSGVKPLSDLLISSPIPVKVAAIDALGRIGGDEAQKVLKKYSKHPDPRVRRAVASQPKS